MKKKILIALTFVGLALIRAKADLPCDYDDIVRLYGDPTPGAQGARPVAATSSGHSHGTNFSFDGIDIKITFGQPGIKSISYYRQVALNELEIEGLLKGIANGGSWVRQGDHDWTLPNSTAKAHWDGVGKLNVSR